MTSRKAEIDLEMDKIAKEVFEICVKNGKSIIDEEETAAKLRKLLATVSSKDSSSLVFDILEMVDAVLGSTMPVDTEARKKMSAILKKCTVGIIPEDVVKVNIDTVGDDAAVNQRLVKMKTKLFFKQLKFNLLREESEGYAKLITELSHYDDGISPVETLNRVRCLIGQFNLDPNRSLDIILECFEAALDNTPVSADISNSNVVSYYSELLKAYHPNSDDLCHVVGFKFTFYAAKRAAAAAVSAPASLYLLAAVLISHGMIDIAELCSYLSPKVEPILAEQKEIMEAANVRCKTLSCSALGPDWDPAEGNAEDSGTPGEQAASTNNQKIGLTQALLQLDAWKEAKYMLDRLPEFYAVRHPAVASSLCRLIDSMVDGIYRRLCPQYCIAVPASNGKDGDDKITSLSEFVRDLLPILTYLGPHLSIDPVLMTKIIRLCLLAYAKASSQTEQENIDPAQIVDICEDVLLPSLSRLRSNCPMSEELWALLVQFPYTTRFRMYGRLKAEHEKRHPILIVAKGETIGKARYIMKRVSKETTKTAGRQLGKLSHSCATSVFDYILNQIQQFENLIGPVVDSLKYLTNLSYDALAFSIIEHLSSPEKEKLKVSDATLSPWLQSLATFVGSVCKKYNVELTGILQYVANQLKSGKSFDLLVLRQIIENMSGIETTSGLTRDQLEALSGGDTLKSEAGNFGQIRNTKRSVSRLKDALMQEDLVVSLCILMGQQRGCIVFSEGASLHLKLAGQMLDQCQDTLVQFGNFLATSLKSEDYVKRMPSAPELISLYQLAPETAIFLSRPAYQYKVVAKYEELKKADRANKVTPNQERKQQHYKTAWESIFGPLTTELTKVFPAKTWADMKPRIFNTFWMLTMYDLSVPTAAYDREIDRLKKLAQQSDESRDLTDGKRRKEKERYQQLEGKLIEEKRRQQEHVERTMAQLMEERQDWFPPKAARNASITQFLQMCLLPRIVFSDVDALYAAKFIHTLHRIKTASFSTLICYDRIFCDIAPILFSMSENEANHYGLFLCAALETVMHWWTDQETFDKECTNFPGFITRFRNPASDTDAANNVVEFDTFRHVVHKWHFKLTRTFLMALSSTSFIGVRNALLVLRKVLPQYPASNSFSQVIEKKVVQLRDEEKEKRQDLHILAASYWGKLKVRKGPLLMDSDVQAQHKDKDVTTSAAAAKARVAARMATPEKTANTQTVGSSRAQASSITADGAKAKTENGVATAPGSAAASPARTSALAGSKVTLRKENKPAATTSTSASSKKPTTVQNSEVSAESKQAAGGVKLSVDLSAAEKKSKQQQQVQKTTTTPSSPAPAASSSVNGGGQSGAKSASGQQTLSDGEPKAKRLRKSAAEGTPGVGTANPNGASAVSKSQQQSAAVDGSPKRVSSKKTAEKAEEAEPKSKRRKVEDQSPRPSDKVSATPPPPSSSNHRREGSLERRHVIAPSHGSDRESRDRERNEKLPRTSSHAALNVDRHEKKVQETIKRERSPKQAQSPVGSSSASAKKKENEDTKTPQTHERSGSSSGTSDRRKLRLSSSSSKPPTSSGGAEKSKHGGSSTPTTKGREDEKRSSRSRKD